MTFRYFSFLKQGSGFNIISEENDTGGLFKKFPLVHETFVSEKYSGYQNKYKVQGF